MASAVFGGAPETHHLWVEMIQCRVRTKGDQEASLSGSIGGTAFQQEPQVRQALRRGSRLLWRRA